MTDVVGVRFKPVGKIYYFSPGDLELKKGDTVVVETIRGIECGNIVLEKRQVDDTEIISSLKSVIRVATDDDIKQKSENDKKEKEAFDICKQKIKKHKLAMKLVDVQYTLDAGKILFYFIADGRIDFRDLAKDLASVFKTRIELRQIGVRDEAKLKGGIGVCGREYCCSTFLTHFSPVSIKMAKEQMLSLNPEKISGCCGKLMCCLKNEEETYKYLLKTTPAPGAIVKTPNGKGVVVDSNIITGKLEISFDKKGQIPNRIFDKREVKQIRGAKVRVSKEDLEAFKKIEDE
ncbi:MAG: stage 0 sporulation family protein [Clostridia bacterium]|nr:stage 0 sporulation family protein [Clostridia bacterium]